tara:strand:- start:96 stop:1028 length:933 start_codon:yes stop_codon:yes gene_type:complete
MGVLNSFDKENKAIHGKKLNVVKKDIEKSIFLKKIEIENVELEKKIDSEKIDISLPPRPNLMGCIHPLSRTFDELISILSNMGFSVEEGPHIENEYNNFTALNISENHPARQEHDTFYLKGNKKLLRTHTSPVQIRVLKRDKPPIKIIAPGATYRCDDDSTHSPMFHQIEGLFVDKKVSMASLKSTIRKLITDFFGTEISVRFRPSYFPFTEPSAEVDIGFYKEGNNLKLGGDKNWLEVLGCGIVNPVVLDNCGIDRKNFSGFAFGLGVERFSMLKYGISDLRMFYDNDLKWLKHYGYQSLGFSKLVKVK